MDDKNNIGITTGVVVGFFLALMVSSIFIPISIGVGGLFDHVRNNKSKK